MRRRQTNGNLFAYSLNNPVCYTDPDGRCAFSSDPDEINYICSIELSNVLRSCVGAYYSHKRMPTAFEMDCSGMLVYALDKMGYEVPSDVTAEKIANGTYDWIEILDDVDSARQGEAGMLNLYYFDQSYVSHVNYGVGKQDDESENQVVDASSLGTGWQINRNKSLKQNPKAYPGKINKTWEPFSTNTDPDLQARVDFTKLKRKNEENN